MFEEFIVCRGNGLSYCRCATEGAANEMANEWGRMYPDTKIEVFKRLRTILYKKRIELDLSITD